MMSRIHSNGFKNEIIFKNNGDIYRLNIDIDGANIWRKLTDDGFSIIYADEYEKINNLYKDSQK